MKSFSRKFRENKIFSGIWEKKNKIVRAGLSRLHCTCSEDILWEKFWNKNDEKSINFSQSWSKVFQHGCQKCIQHVLRSILRWSFLTNFLLFLELYQKILSTVVKTAFLVPVRKLWGKKSFEKTSQLKELCFWLWPKNVQSLFKTALYVSKGKFCHLRLKNLYSLETFPDSEQKPMEFYEIFFWRILKTELYVSRGRFIRVKAYEKNQGKHWTLFGLWA